MKIRITTRAQEQEEHAKRMEEMRAHLERDKFLGRCLFALREAHNYLCDFYPDKINKEDLKATIKSLLDRK